MINQRLKGATVSMRKIITISLLAFFMVLAFAPIAYAGHISGNPGGVRACDPDSNLLGFPNWYRGLDCEDGGHNGVVFNDLNNIWTVVANVLDIVIRLAGLAAVFVLIYAGIRYITSQGKPDSLEAAKQTITYAIIGLVLAIMGATIVGFIAGQF